MEFLQSVTQHWAIDLCEEVCTNFDLRVGSNA